MLATDHPAWLVFLVWSLIVGACVFATISDLRCRRIPNRLTLPLLAGGLLTAGLVAGMSGLIAALAGMAIAGCRSWCSGCLQAAGRVTPN